MEQQLDTVKNTLLLLQKSGTVLLRYVSINYILDCIEVVVPVEPTLAVRGIAPWKY